jgi:NAD(P)H-hydrate epimerase
MSAVLEGEKNAVSAPPLNNIKYLTLDEANQIESDLMSDDGGYSLNTIMELAGKSIADAIYEEYPLEEMARNKILIICGKGNCGGYGLVAARHLHYFGYEVEVVYPERAMREPFTGFAKQLKNLDVRVNMGMPGTANRLGLIVDAIFGLSFEPPLKAPWELILKQLNSPDYFAGIPILSIDVPACWDVARGPPKDGTFAAMPETLVSIAAPKLCSTRFQGTHYLGGRFVPSRMQFKYKLNLPKFESARSTVIMPPPPPVVEEDEAEEA